MPPFATATAEIHDLDLQEHLALVGHVVQELSLRVPAHIDRAAMFNHGAMGLLVAARRQERGSGDFASQALRAIRAAVIGNLSSDQAPPGDDEVARLLGVPTLALRSARSASTHTGVPVRRNATMRGSDPTAPQQPRRRPSLGQAPRPAFIGAT